MKLGILTASRTNNFGTDLQAYAMQLLFNKYCDTEIIDYVCPKLERSHKLLKKLSVVEIIRLPWKIYKNISHCYFRKNFFKTSNTYTKETIEKVNYDGIVVGSDQIWNLDITDNDFNFFLPFNGIKKYAYAASIGKSDIRDWQEKYNIKKYLDDFTTIAVREHSGVVALENIDVKSQYVLDPLLMVDKNEWKKFATYRTPKKYVFVYLIQENSQAIQYARDYAEKNGLEVVIFQAPGKFKKGIKKCVYCNLQRWISYMLNANQVITNSYHGLSMAVALEKDFRVFGICSAVQNNSRMIDLLKTISLEEYLFIDCVDEELKSPDWKKVSELLEVEQNKSHKYISDIVKQIIGEDNL